MVQAWRITKPEYASSAFSGEGALRYRGRWNSPGVPMVYTAASRSLAQLELLVHLNAGELAKPLTIFTIDFDDAIVEAVDSRRLPADWRDSPPPLALQEIGDEWFARKGHAVLRVPSAVVPEEWTYLLNPTHPDFKTILIGREELLRVDPRLVKK